MMATGDVGCTAKSITTCNNLSWSSVSLCQGEEEPRGDYHDRAAFFIESSSCLGHMAHSLRSSGSRHLPDQPRVCAAHNHPVSGVPCVGSRRHPFPWTAVSMWQSVRHVYIRSYTPQPANSLSVPQSRTQWPTVITLPYETWDPRPNNANGSFTADIAPTT